jgi:hypothetical protein
MGMQAEGAESKDVTGRPLRRDADAQPARPWCGCGGGYIRTVGLLRFAPPGPGNPSRRPPVVRRRDRRRADGDARRAEGAQLPGLP